MQLDRDPRVAGKLSGDPASLLQNCVGDSFSLGRDPNREQALRRAWKVVTREAVFALLGRSPARGDELAHRFIAAKARDEEDELQSVGQRDLGPDDELHAQLLR